MWYCVLCKDVLSSVLVTSDHHVLTFGFYISSFRFCVLYYVFWRAHARCVCFFCFCFKGIDKGHKRKWGKSGNSVCYFFQHFICCTIRNTNSFCTKVTGHMLPVYWPLLIVKTRKSLVTNTKKHTKYPYTNHNVKYRLRCKWTLISVLTMHINTCTNAERFHLET